MGRREEKRAQTKEQILSAAAWLIAEKGYDNTTLDDVTERANVSRGTFYYNFAAKEDLVVELSLSSLSSSIESALAMSSKGAASEQALERLLLDAAEFGERFPELAKVFFALKINELAPFEDFQTRTGEQAKPARFQFHRAIQELVRNAQKNGQIRSDLAPDDLSGMIIAVFLQALESWNATECSTSLVEKVHVRIHAMLEGLAIGCYGNRESCAEKQRESNNKQSLAP